MRYRLLALAIPTGIVTCADISATQTFLTEEQALRSLFGTSRISREEKSLSDPDRQALLKATGLHFPETLFTFLMAEQDGRKTGYALVMNELGKSEPITFMVAINTEHRVVDVLVMTFRESRGAEVREARFLRQFKGKRGADPIVVNNDIINYSGATLSSKAIARGVKRALGLLDYFYPAAAARPHAFAPAFALPVLPVAGQPRTYRQARYLMGTLCEIRLEADSSAHASVAAAAAFSEIRRLEKIFSAYDPASELSEINRDASRGPIKVSNDMWKLARAAVRYARATGGAVDITFKGRAGIQNVRLDGKNRTIHFMTGDTQLDFGGLAKGYAARRAVETLERWGIRSALVNLGGSSIATGSGGTGWLAGLADPASPNRYAAILKIEPGDALTCSGTYERERHIIDPRTGVPITGLRSATVMTKSPLLGEVLSKASLLEPRFLKPRRNYVLLNGEGEA